MNRWIELYATTPSGKTLFVCKICGAQTPAPTKKCSEPPSAVSWKTVFPCHVMEEVEAALIDVGEKEPSGPDIQLQIHLRGNEGTVSWKTPQGAQRSMPIKVKRK